MKDAEILNWFNQKPKLVEQDLSWPKISIITPSFNQGDFIEQTILSVLNQNYPNLEFIIIDGGSKDQTLSIIKKYEEFISYWVSEPDRGQTDAINKGFEKCTGEIFNWLNSDDLLAPNSLFEIAKLFITNKTVSCVSGREERFLENKILNLSVGTSIEPSLEETITKAHIDQPSTFFRRSFIQAIFPLDTTLRYCMDNQIWINYLLTYGQNNIVKTDKVLIYFRYHYDSKTVKYGHDFRSEIHRLILSALVAVDPSQKDELVKRNIVPITFNQINQKIDIDRLRDLVLNRIDKYKDDISILYYEYAGYYRMMSLKKNSRAYLWMAIKVKPLNRIYWKALIKNLVS